MYYRSTELASHFTPSLITSLQEQIQALKSQLRKMQKYWEKKSEITIDPVTGGTYCFICYRISHNNYYCTFCHNIFDGSLRELHDLVMKKIEEKKEDGLFNITIPLGNINNELGKQLEDLIWKKYKYYSYYSEKEKYINVYNY